MKNSTFLTVFFIISLFLNSNSSVQAQTPLAKIDIKTMSIFSAHKIAAPKKYKYTGERSNSTLTLTFKDIERKRVYYLTSSKPADLVYMGKDNLSSYVKGYISTYKSEMIKSGWSVKELNYQGIKALYGVLLSQGVYIYQLHFINKDKAQTIQMINQTKSDLLFQEYMNEIKIIL